MVQCENATMAPVKKKHAPLRPTYLAAWRDYRGLNQDQVAETIGVSRTLLSKIEQGKSPYTQRTLEALAKAYECEPGDLLSWHPVERVVGEVEATILLRRLALIPHGEERKAYGLLMKVWGPDDEPPLSVHPHDQSTGATPRRESTPSRRQSVRSGA